MNAELHVDVLDVERASNCETSNVVVFDEFFDVQCVVVHLYHCPPARKRMCKGHRVWTSMVAVC